MKQIKLIILSFSVVLLVNVQASAENNLKVHLLENKQSIKGIQSYNPVSAKYLFTISGSKVGSETYSETSKGKFKSVSKLAVGSVVISSQVSGNLSQSVVKSYSIDTNSPASEVKMSWNGKTVTVTKPIKKVVPYDGQALLWFSNYHPAIISNLNTILTKSDSTTIKGKVYVLESGVLVPGSLSMLGTQTYTLDGDPKICKHFQLKIAGLVIELYQTENGMLVGEQVKTEHFEAVLVGVKGLFNDPLLKYKNLSQPKYQTKTITNLVCKTRDGVNLATSAVMPTQPGRYPIILERTPYGRNASLLGAEVYAKRGYVFIAQDVRGTGDSGGKWDPMMHEEKDGYDAVEWAAHQPWSNGKVGMIGGSYLGYVQWAAAVEQPPALKCIVPQVSPPDAMTNLPYEFGTFLLFPDLWWLNIDGTGKANLLAATVPPKKPKAILDLPLSVIPKEMYGRSMPIFTKWLKRTGYPDFKGFDYEKSILKVKIPVLNISGWWDGDGIGTDLNWIKMQRNGRKNMWLIEGPWTHSFDTTSQLGNDHYGSKAIIDLDPLYLRWFDHWLKGKHDGLMQVPKVQYFVMTENRWHKTNRFPDPESKKRTMYLGSKGTLAFHRSTGEDTYIYNPAKVKVPVGLSGNPIAQPATIDLKFADKNDHLDYLSSPFKKKVDVTGPFMVNLYFKISTVTTDLYAYLFVQDKAGNRLPLGVEGKLNLSYLNGLDRPRNLLPNHIYLAHVMPWISAREILPGERLGVVIISQDFPYTARNLNTGEPIVNATRMKIAHVTILHDRTHPSSFTYFAMRGH